MQVGQAPLPRPLAVVHAQSRTAADIMVEFMVDWTCQRVRPIWAPMPQRKKRSPEAWLMADDLAAAWSSLPSDVFDGIDWSAKAYTSKSRNHGPDWPCLVHFAPVLKPIVQMAPSALPKLMPIKTAACLACKRRTNSTVCWLDQ